MNAQHVESALTLAGFPPDKKSPTKTKGILLEYTRKPKVEVEIPTKGNTVIRLVGELITVEHKIPTQRIPEIVGLVQNHLKPAETPLLVLQVKWEILREVFGERFWNDNENIICVPTNRINPDEWWQLETNHNVTNAREVQYLISEL